MNRRTFLQLATVSAAAAAAGTVAAALWGGRGDELPITWDQTPTWTDDWITGANNRPAHELLSSAHPDITLVDDDDGYLIWPEYQAELAERLERITETPAPCA